MKKYLSLLVLALLVASSLLLVRTSFAKVAALKLHKSTFSCGDTITDRDNYSYGTVAIGAQCWLAKNLETKTKPNNTPLTNRSDGSERDCSNDQAIHGSEADCDAGNAIYTFTAAMNGSTSLFAQGLCPNGWHVPTDSEWHFLEAYLKDGTNSCDSFRNGTFDCDTAGTKLKIGGSANFDASLSGIRSTDPMFGDMFADFDTGGYFWSSTITGTTTFLHNVNTNEAGVWRGTQSTTAPYLSASLRCILN